MVAFLNKGTTVYLTPGAHAWHRWLGEAKWTCFGTGFLLGLAGAAWGQVAARIESGMKRRAVSGVPDGA